MPRNVLPGPRERSRSLSLGGDISSNEGGISRAVAAAGRRRSTAGRPRGRQPGSGHGDRDLVNVAAPVEGCIRETGDEVIIDSTAALLSTDRFAFERVRR